MPSYLEGQLGGKYKGVEFGVRSESLNAVGQTRVKHTYPKTSVQYMEPMGEEPFNATIEIFFSGTDFREDFQRFERAMRDPAPGRLFMPTFGVFDNVVAEPASASSSQTDLGEISMSVTFSVTTERPSPTEATATSQDVSEQAQASREALQEVFTDEYPEPTTVNNLQVASSDSKNLADGIKKITGNVRDVRNFVRKVDQRIRNVQAYGALLLNPGQPTGFLQSLALSISNFSGFTLWKQIATLGKNQPNAMNDIRDGVIPIVSSFVEDLPPTGALDATINLWPEDTIERQERNQIRLTTINTFRMVGLIGMYEAAAAQSYTTTDDVDKVTADLELYYETLVENAGSDVIILAIKQFLDILRNLTDSVLAQKRQQAFAVIEIDVLRPVSSSLLAYELYGEYIQNEQQLIDVAELLAGLNTSLPRHRLMGAVKVVEIVS